MNPIFLSLYNLSESCFKANGVQVPTPSLSNMGYLTCDRRKMKIMLQGIKERNSQVLLLVQQDKKTG